MDAALYPGDLGGNAIYAWDLPSHDLLCRLPWVFVNMFFAVVHTSVVKYIAPAPVSECEGGLTKSTRIHRSTRESFFTRVNVEVWTSSLLFTVHPGVHPYARVFTLASTGLWAAVPPTPADTCDGTAEDKNGYIDEGVTGRTRSLGFFARKLS